MYRFDRYLTVSKKMLSAIGLWKTQTQRQRFFRYCIIGFMTLYAIFGESCQLIYSKSDFRSTVHVLQIFVFTICGTSEYLTYTLQFNNLHEMYNYILIDWQRLRDDTELKIMQKYAAYGNIVALIGLVSSYLYLIISTFTSLLRIILYTNEIRSDLDTYPIISCFDYFSSRSTYYYPILMYQIITSFILVTVWIVSYSLYIIFIQHACARLSIIIYRIYFPFLHSNYINHIPTTPIDFCPWIIDIAQCLARITEYMTLVNTTFEKSYMFQIFLAFFIFILNFLCIPVLIENKTSISDLFGFGVYISGTLFIIYANCYIGQILMDYSKDVYREACLIPFHEMSLEAQKLLLTILKMYSKPIDISIGKVYVASNEFFSNMVRSSLSFAMVISSLQMI